MRTAPALLSLLILGLATTASAAPNVLTHQGRVFNSLGVPLDGDHDITVAIYDDPAGTSSLWAETQNTTFNNGFFSVTLGETTALPDDLFDDDDRHVGLTIDTGSEFPGRLALSSVPFALQTRHADSANSVSGGIVDATEIRVGGTTIIDGTGAVVSGVPDDTLASLSCSDGDIARLVGGVWACSADIGLNQAEVDALIGAIDLSGYMTVSAHNTDMADVVRTGDITDVVRTGDITDVVRTGDITDVVRTGDITDVVRTSDITDVVRTGDITDVVRTGDITDVVRTADIASFVTQADTDPLYVDVGGDAMTGDLDVDGAVAVTGSVTARSFGNATGFDEAAVLDTYPVGVSWQTGRGSSAPAGTACRYGIVQTMYFSDCRARQICYQSDDVVLTRYLAAHCAADGPWAPWAQIAP